MSPRDRVLEQAGKVVTAWKRRHTMPIELHAEMVDLQTVIAEMNAQAHTRKRDPETSRQAAGSVRLNANRTEVLLLLRQRPRTDEELVACLSGQMSPSGARTRRAELVRMGMVEASGKQRRSSAGRLANVWQAVR